MQSDLRGRPQYVLPVGSDLMLKASEVQAQMAATAAVPAVGRDDAGLSVRSRQREVSSFQAITEGTRPGRRCRSGRR